MFVEGQMEASFLLRYENVVFLPFSPLPLSHHLRQVFKSSPSFVDNLVKSVRRTNRSYNDLITPRSKAFECLLHKRENWHT